MPRFIAFLRAINVGGHTVKMDDLRHLFEALGFSRVETFIASGNVVFESRSKDTRKLERQIEAHLKASLGYDVATFLRSEAEVTAVARYKPFEDRDVESAGAFVVGFLTDPLGEDAVKALKRLESDLDRFHVEGREIYWLCRKGQGESTFSNAVFEKTLRTRATFRGFKTVVKLAAKHITSPSISAPRPRRRAT